MGTEAPGPPGGPGAERPLRERLRDLGYLGGEGAADAGFESFLAARLTTRSGLLRVCAGLAWRAGLPAAALVTVCVTLGLGVLDPGLTAHPGRWAALAGLLLAAYAVLAVPTVFLLSVVGAAVLSRLSPARAARLPEVAGFGTAAALLAYAVLWWRGQGSLLGFDPWGTTGLIALPAAAAASWAAGGLARMVTEVLLSRVGGGARREPRPRRRMRAVLRAVLLVAGAVAMAASLAVADARGGDGAAWAADVRPADRPPLVIVAVDGVGAAVLDDLAGEVGPDGLPRAPMLAALRERSARATLQPAGAREPAEAWTTLLTGVGPGRHGIVGAAGPTLPGPIDRLVLDRGGRLTDVARRVFPFLGLTRPGPVTSLSRRAKGVWEVAWDADLSAAAVGLWATWPGPADTGDGILLISDRAYPVLLAGGDTGGVTIGTAAEAAARGAFVRPADAPARDGLPGGLPGADALGEDARHDLRQAWALDLFARDAAAHLLRAGPPRVTVVYLPGPDLARERLAHGTEGVDALRWGPVLEAYLARLDGHLRVLREAAPGARLALVAHPGRPVLRDADAAARGALWLSGPGIVPGEIGEPPARAAGVLDVAPTLLHLAGLPASREQPGAVLPVLGDGPAPPPRVAAFGPPRPAAPAEDPFADAMLERLRALGYVD